MKANKHENIDISQPVELTANLEGLGEFHITGMYDEVAPYATSHVEAPQAPVKVQGGNAGLVSEPLNGIRANVTAITYDVLNGTRFYDALRQQRQLRKDLAMVQSLGLLAVEPCQKHRQALEGVKTLRG